MMHIVLTFILQLDVLDGALKKNPCDDLFSLFHNSLTTVSFHQIDVILRFVDTDKDILNGRDSGSGLFSNSSAVREYILV